MHADSEGEWRLSLAGAQDKLPVVVGADGRVGLTRGRTPSTHILKTPIDRLPRTPSPTRHSASSWGRRLGIDTVEAIRQRRAGLRECLLGSLATTVEVTAAGTERLHQEDFCQALGIPSQRKYEAGGRPWTGRLLCPATHRERAYPGSRVAETARLRRPRSFLVGR